MCSSHLIKNNLNVAKKLISEPAKNGAGLIQYFLSSQASTHGVWIIGGTIPISCSDRNKIRAASIVYNGVLRRTDINSKKYGFDVRLTILKNVVSVSMRDGHTP